MFCKTQTLQIIINDDEKNVLKRRSKVAVTTNATMDSATIKKTTAGTMSRAKTDTMKSAAHQVSAPSVFSLRHVELERLSLDSLSSQV